MTNEPAAASAKLKSHTLLSWIMMGLGLLLLIYMVTVEDEPGAVPLALLAGGAIWNRLTHRRRKALKG